jgi:hypothetical protein
LALGILLGVFRGFLQATPEPPPDPPLLAAAPDPGSWTIIVKQKRPPPPRTADPRLLALQSLLLKANPRMVQQKVEKAGKEWHGETQWEDGSSDTLWIYRGMALFRPRNYPPDKIGMMGANAPLAPHPPAVDFPDLTWIDAKCFVGSTDYQGTKCYLYQQGSSSSQNGQISAWIAADSRLPIALEDDSVLKTYTFNSAPSTLQLDGLFASTYRRFLNAPKTVLRPSDKGPPQ